MSLRAHVRGYFNDALRAFDRAPLEVALAVLTAALFSYAIENSAPEAWVQVAVAAALALAIAWSATLLHALGSVSFVQRWLLTAVGALCGIVYYSSVDDIQRDAEGWRAFMLIGAALLLVFSVPGWYRSDQASLRLRRINGRFLLRALGISLYGLALFGGLALALRAIAQLFELDLDGEIYGHVFGWIMLVLVPWVVAGGLYEYIRPLDEQSDIARVVQRLTSFLVPPLLVIYFIILYVYAARIAITGELPKNLVSPMVIAAGLLAALAITLFDPAPADARAGARLLRAAPPAFLPLVPLGLWAITFRIDAYGWTEFRVLRVMLLIQLGVLAALASWQVWRRRSFTLRVAPLLLGATLLFTAVGPWSVMALARRDQQARLRSALRAANVDPAAVIARDTTVRIIDSTLYERINSGGAYLRSHFGEEALAEVAGAYAALEQGNWMLADNFGLAPDRSTAAHQHFFGTLPPDGAVAIANGTAYRVQLGGMLSADSTRLTLRLRGQTLYADVTPLIGRLTPERGRDANYLNQSVEVRDSAHQRRGDLIVLQLAVQRSRDSLKIHQLDGVLLYHEARQR